MMTVNEVSKLTGVSIRALQYYDKIGLLHPAEYTEAGYRLYDDTALERLQQILLFRELEFSLKEIQSILQSPDFDRDRALDQQICLLTLKKEHIENLITFARGLKQVGGMNMDFSAFDTAKMDEYATKAKEKWQHTNAYQEYTQKNKGRSKDAEEALARGVMLIFSDFGKCKDGDPALPEAQALVKRLQAYISENYYQCTPEILQTLGAMYVVAGMGGIIFPAALCLLIRCNRKFWIWYAVFIVRLICIWSLLLAAISIVLFKFGILLSNDDMTQILQIYPQQWWVCGVLIVVMCLSLCISMAKSKPIQRIVKEL